MADYENVGPGGKDGQGPEGGVPPPPPAAAPDAPPAAPAAPAAAGDLPPPSFAAQSNEAKPNTGSADGGKEVKKEGEGGASMSREGGASMSREGGNTPKDKGANNAKRQAALESKKRKRRMILFIVLPILNVLLLGAFTAYIFIDACTSGDEVTGDHISRDFVTPDE